MRMNKILPVVLSLAISGAVVTWADLVKTPSLKMLASNEKEEGPESEEQDIRGAIESIYSMRMNEQTGTLDPQWMMDAVQKADAMQSVSKRLNKNIIWEGLGPDNVGGRIRAFLISKKDKNVWFAGGVSGGLFRSTTYGQSWAPVNDMQENLNVTCIAQLPVSGKVFYGTGEGGFTNLSGTRNGSPAFIGNGVYESKDQAGDDFSLIATAKDARFHQCNSMAASPTEDILYVASESGLFEFNYTSGSTPVITRLVGTAVREVKVDKKGTIWASSSNGAVYKKPVGAALATVNAGYNSGGRTAIGISPDDDNVVYTLGAGGNGKMVALYRTKDGGSTWEILVTGNTVTDIFGPNSQGWYDNAVSVVPGSNSKKAILGGVDLATWDEVNGYRQIASTFGAPWNQQYVHADKHLIEWNTDTKPATCIVGCDGGLFASKDLSVWTSINRGFTTLQLYNVAANYLGHVVGGAQDNGTQLINYSGNSVNGKLSQTALSIYGGDGFDVEFSKFNPKVVFASTYYGRVVRSSNQGQSMGTFWDDRQEGTVQSDFNTTFSLWEKNDKESRLYLSKDQEVWAAINPTNFSEQVNWILIAKGLGGSRIIEMDYTPDGNHLFVAKAGSLWRIDGLNDADYSLAANPKATDVPAAITQKQLTVTGASGRVVTSVNVNMNNANHVVITLGGYGNTRFVMESNDALSATPTWTDITGNLPSMPVYDAVIDPDDENRIVIGTDLGIWVTENGGTTWTEANQGMARVPVFEIRGYEWKPWMGMEMYIGTHGRGYFKSSTLLSSTKKVARNSFAVSAYPNPATDKATVSFQAVAAGNANITVIGLDGRTVYNKQINVTAGSNEAVINTENYTSGYYFVKVTLSNGSSQSVKLMVK